MLVQPRYADVWRKEEVRLLPAHPYPLAFLVTLE